MIFTQTVVVDGGVGGGGSGTGEVVRESLSSRLNHPPHPYLLIRFLSMQTFNLIMISLMEFSFFIFISISLFYTSFPPFLLENSQKHNTETTASRDCSVNAKKKLTTYSF